MIEKIRMVLYNSRRRLLIFLAILGPSIITTMAGNDGGGVITYSLGGAQVGYSILYILPALLVLTAITQEMGSRIAIATGKGLGDIIREQFGIRIAFAVFVCLLVANFGTVITNVAAVKAASQMLGIPPIPFIVITVVVAFILITQFSYARSQKLFLSGIIFYFAYIFSAIKGRPDWGAAVTSLVIPPANLITKEYLFISIAVLGTTITPWAQFFVQSYMKDKKIAPEKIGFARLEAYLGAFVAIAIMFFIVIATASTLHVNHIVLQSGEQAALAIRPFAGDLSGVLFAVGLINAAVIGMVIVSLASSYAFTEFFGYEGSLDNPFQKSKAYYGIFIATLVVAGVLVMTPWISLFKIVLYTQSLNGILLPLFFYFLYKIANNAELMGKHVNSRANNYILISSSVLIVLASVGAITISLLGYQ